MLRPLLDRLEAGWTVDGLTFRGRRRRPGRFPEEENLDLYVEDGRTAHLLLYLKAYHGRPGRRPWVELFALRPEGILGGRPWTYFDSAQEAALLEALAGALGPGGDLFVEYGDDPETWDGLTRGVPAPFSRLGARMLAAGFTWFKDWYYPEGFMEGGEKLQGERPLDEAARARHLARIRAEAAAFRARCEAARAVHPAVERACRRARRWLEAGTPALDGAARLGVGRSSPGNGGEAPGTGRPETG